MFDDCRVAILGLFPASMATGIGSDVQRPLATVIVYGLLFSTIINSCLQLSSLYYLVERRFIKTKQNKYETNII